MNVCFFSTIWSSVGGGGDGGGGGGGSFFFRKFVLTFIYLFSYLVYFGLFRYKLVGEKQREEWVVLGVPRGNDGRKAGF